MTEVQKTDQEREHELREELDEQERRDEQLAEKLRQGERREGELTEELRELDEREEVEAEVLFPLASNSPYRERVSRDQAAREVLASAMRYFGVSDDQTTKYELYHEGDLVNLDERLGSLAEHAHEVKFTLSKEIING